jgi:hypothetical protein
VHVKWLRRCKEVLLGLAAFSCWSWLMACSGAVEPLSSAPPLSQSLDPKPSSALTHPILTALILEHRQDYRLAWSIWSRLPEDHLAVREHCFMTELLMRSELPGTLPMDSEPALLLATAYLKWRLEWDQAFRLLQRYQPTAGTGISIRLEMIRVSMLLGRYQIAAELLAISDDGLSAAERFSLAVLEAQHALLTEDWEAARTALTVMAADDQFVNTRVPFLVWSSKDTVAAEERLIRQAIWFPSDLATLDELLTLQRQTGNWRFFEAAINVHPLLESEPIDWRLIAAVYSHNDRWDLLEQLLGEVESVAGTSLDYLAYAAQAALLTQDWERLHEIADRYRHFYPELNDDDWFLEQLPVEASQPMQ